MGRRHHALRTLIGVGAVAVFVFTGCASDNVGSNENVQLSTNDVTPSVTTFAESETGEMQNVSYKEAQISNNTSLVVPSEWVSATIPGADVGFLVTTAPNNQSLGITLLSESELSQEMSTENLLNSVVEDVKLFNADDPNFSVEILPNEAQSEVDSEEGGPNRSTIVVLGTIVVRANNSDTFLWVIEKNKETFLVTLGKAYSDGNNGAQGSGEGEISTPDQNEPDETFIEAPLPSGSAEKQVNFVLR